MPTCQNCHTEWSWKETMKASMILDTRMTCPHCQQAQYTSKQTHKRFMIYTPIMLVFVIFLPQIIDLSLTATIAFAVFLIIATLSATPLLLNLSNEEEFLFDKD
ncbi:TIGR04104 family putative zinc finger protein [Halalkalibacillus halophilus]|uniref:TIGR04104 family putative zinc finger protein n=1 Tax=Halalkalibacillus halophilus TaxID=392827 RepID=UPI0003F664BF|nr:TIGR04104 family putative zinc finger protein [Halalkalibacillus halophilus]